MAGVPAPVALDSEDSSAAAKGASLAGATANSVAATPGVSAAACLLPDHPPPPCPPARRLAGSPVDAAAKSSTPSGFGAQPDFKSSRRPPLAGGASPAPTAYLRHSDTPLSGLGPIIAARARRVFDRAGRRITQRTLRIGVSRAELPSGARRAGAARQDAAISAGIDTHWVMWRDVLVFMIPTVGHEGMLPLSNIRLLDYAKHLDGLLQQGGADVSPQTFVASDACPEYPGDRVCDMFEFRTTYNGSLGASMTFESREMTYHVTLF